MRVPSLPVLAVLALLPFGESRAHPGGVDAQGCHRDRVAGERHCHPDRADRKDLPTPFEARVVRVYDGDTVDVLVEGSPRRIRLFGIDAPERYQDHSIQSRKHLGELVHQKTVQVVVRDLDKYGRWVADLKVGKLDVCLEMVKAGYAWWYEKYAPDRTALRDAQEEAQGARRGLWVDKNPILPSMFRRAKKRVPAS